MSDNSQMHPKRKSYRLADYDYSTPGAYFITVCTKDKRCILGHLTVGAGIARPSAMVLSEYGEIVCDAIRNIEKHYPALSVDNYVIMPNHIHLLLRISSDENGRPMVAPTVSRVIQQMKGYCTKQAGQDMWQKLFHDHIIRSSKDYEEIWNYIDTNPIRWLEDCYYSENFQE